MALIIMEGFDTFTTVSKYVGKWNRVNGQIWIGGGRQGTNALYHHDGLFCEKPFDNAKTIIFGYALKLNTTGTWSLVQFEEPGGVQASIRTDSSNQIIINRSTSTTIAYTGYYIPTNTWIYLELKLTIDNVNGAYELRINGKLEAAEGGLDTQWGGSDYVNKIEFIMKRLGGSCYMDDIYVCDTTSSFCNDFLGDVHVETIFPSGDGYLNEWVEEPAGGGHYTKLDEDDPNDDTDFVATSGVGYIDSFVYDNLIALSGQVFGVQINAWARKDDEGSRTLNAIARVNSTTYSGINPVSIGDSYAYRVFNFDTNPDTAGYWTIADINAAEFGIKEEA
jgi:hypothetical protein